MVYVNTLESPNFTGARRRRATPSAGGTLVKVAHFAAALGLMIVIAAALVAHGLVHACATALSDRAIRKHVRRNALQQDVAPPAAGHLGTCYY